MNAITRTVLIAIVSNILMLFVNVPPLVSGDCGDGMGRNGVRVLPLKHGHPVTLGYQVMLAGDAAASKRLMGHSVINIAFEPSGKGLGYGVERESLPVQDVTPLLVTGDNNVKLFAVDTRDHAWLTVRTPCPPPMVAVPTATWVLVPTPTPAALAEEAIVTQTPVILHMDKTVDSGKAQAPRVDGNINTARDTLTGRIATGLTLLVMLALVLGKPRRWWQWVQDHAPRVDRAVVLHQARIGWDWLCQLKRKLLG